MAVFMGKGRHLVTKYRRYLILGKVLNHLANTPTQSVYLSEILKNK